MKFRIIPPILMILFPYLLILPILSGTVGITIDYTAYYFPVVIPGFLCVLLLNAMNALIGKWEVGELARWNMVDKLALIPFYCFIFILGIGVMAAIPPLYIMNVMILLSTSTYGIHALVKARKDPALGTMPFWLMLICHFLFVADVIAAVYLKSKSKYL